MLVSLKNVNQYVSLEGLSPEVNKDVSQFKKR